MSIDENGRELTSIMINNVVNIRIEFKLEDRKVHKEF